jgi:hypothetical protein
VPLFQRRTRINVETMRARIRAEVVRTFELEPIELPDGDVIVLRAEILRVDRGKFTARLWRVERFRVQPSFPQQDGTPSHLASDEALLVEEPGVLDSGFPRNPADPESVLTELVEAVEHRFGDTRGG